MQSALFVQQTGALPDMVARLDALVCLNHLKRDLLQAKEEDRELATEIRTTNHAWEKALVLRMEDSINDDELLQVQV